jgi:D-3-phosphoglycerate dehydrogenase / 2-oxoglutarate reductase
VGKTLAILGFGKVGSEVARRAKGLGMHVIAHDPYASADRARAIGVELVSMEEAMTTADFISLHMPLTPATDKMLNDEAFAKMKKGVRIINVARGGVIDEEALVRALDSGVVAQVCLIILMHLFAFHALINFSEKSLICFPGIMLMFSHFLFCILGCS